MDTLAPILLLGGSGLVGSAVRRLLHDRGHLNLICPSHKELDLCDIDKTVIRFESIRPEYVIIAAGRVGGITANSSRPAEFAHENALIAAHTLRACWLTDVKKAIYLGSSCIYPRNCPQPMREEHLMSGPLEPTNSGYAMAKLLGIELVRAYRREYGCNFYALNPANLYGPGDNFDIGTAHCLPAMVSRMAKAYRLKSDEEVTLLGTGRPRREWLYVDDLADAIIWLLEQPDLPDLPDLLNVGSGEEVTIAELADMVAEEIGFEGPIRFNGREEIDGMPRKIVDTSRINSLGWKAQTTLREGLKKTWKWYSAR